MQESDSVDFGFKKVAARQKTTLVQDVFTSVADRYDLMNDLMSGGVHRLWKKTLIDMICPRPSLHLLDVAGGTGDITFRFLQAGGQKATVCDLTANMVRVGRDRALDRGGISTVDWVVGDAHYLPLPDQYFDVYTIAFGLRNVTDIDLALQEARRVLKPGGRFLCLEFSSVIWPGLAELYEKYSFTVLPQLGEWIAKDRASYQYLVESIRRFPNQSALADRLEKAGLARPRWRNLTGGIAAIHTAWRI